MDFQIHSQGEHGRFEQILTQFLLKSLHIILDSRVPSLRPFSCSREVKKSDKWFNLVLGDRPAALDNLHFWHRSLMEPMIIDIILVQERPSSSSGPDSCSASELGMSRETVIERWVVQYEKLKTVLPVGDGHYKKTYQKSIILLRSLYTIMRFLPAHRASQKLLSLSQTCDFDINYKVSAFSTPFSRAEERLMKRYSLTPVDAQQGRLSISVTYREDLTDFNLETSASFPPEIITDYVGSPLTDPLRVFPSLSSDKGGRAASFSMRGLHQSSSSPFQRPASWTSGIYRQNQQYGGSPPPNSSSSSPTDIYSHKIQNYRLPPHHKSTSSDDYQLSPPFSPSPSPSPPTYLSGGNPVQSRLGSETAPVSIPHTMIGRSPRYLSPNLSDPNRHSLPPLSPKSTRYNPSSQESPSGMKSLRKSESLRLGGSKSGTPSPGQEMSRDVKEDSGRFSGLLSSSGSPRVGFSRSSSRSFQDDMDGGDFSYPFIVDDIDAPDYHASKNLEAKKGSESSSQAKKSQDTAVAALVHLLRTAPPLRQDSSRYSSQACKSELEVGEEDGGSASGFFMARKTSDALEELRSYKDMRDLLLSKSASHHIANKDTKHRPHD